MGLLGLEYITRDLEGLGCIEMGRYPVGALADLRAATASHGTQTTPPTPLAFDLHCPPLVPTLRGTVTCAGGTAARVGGATLLGGAASAGGIPVLQEVLWHCCYLRPCTSIPLHSW